MTSLDPNTVLAEDDALLVVDVQNDFCPGGALAVPDGDRILPVLNDWIDAADRLGLPIIASRDWHPEHHVSFEEREGPWPRHCVQNTPGAAFHPDLRLPDDADIVDKGDTPDHDDYSPFQATDLATLLHNVGVRRIWIGGLAEDVCVKASAIDAAKAGFDARVIADATRPVDPNAADDAVREMTEAGATVVEHA